MEPKLKKRLYVRRKLPKPKKTNKKSALKKFLVCCDVFVILSS